MLTDATLSKFFFQFPPIVLERLCHHMEIQHFESNDVLLEAGATIDSVYIVVTGLFTVTTSKGLTTVAILGTRRWFIKQVRGGCLSSKKYILFQVMHSVPAS